MATSAAWTALGCSEVRGKFTNTQRTFPVRTYSFLIVGNVVSANWRQAGHWKSPSSKTVTGASGRPRLRAVEASGSCPIRDGPGKSARAAAHNGARRTRRTLTCGRRKVGSHWERNTICDAPAARHSGTRRRGCCFTAYPSPEEAACLVLRRCFALDLQSLPCLPGVIPRQ